MDMYMIKNYDKLKLELIKYCKHNGIIFDEDVFHDTLIKCLDKVSDMSNFNNYLFVSFRNNMAREKLYHRNLMHSELPDNYEQSINDTEVLVEYNDLQRLLKQQFGEVLTEIFNKHLEGYSIKELEEMYNTTQLTYKLKKIKDFCKKHL